MKDMMVSHVELIRHTMFHQATDCVKHHLDQLLLNANAEIRGFMDKLFATIEQDYLSVVSAVELPENEKRLRSTMRQHLTHGAESWPSAAN